MKRGSRTLRRAVIPLALLVAAHSGLAGVDRSGSSTPEVIPQHRLGAASAKVDLTAH